MTQMLDKLPHAAGHCHTVLCVFHFVEYCSDDFVHSVRIHSIIAVLGSHYFGLRISVGAPGGTQISTGREDFARGSAFLTMLSEALEKELTDFEAVNATRKGDHMWQGVEIVIGGIPTVLEVRFMCLFMSFGRIMFEDSVSQNLFDQMTHQVDGQKVEVGI